jgi:adenosylcobinamide-GDP ribazoletransferase
MIRLRTDLAAALSLLTRLPTGWLWPANPDHNPARAVWAYSIVGALVGGLGAVIYAACHTLGMPPVLSALWTLAAMLLTTGALHEDGLADTADGFGGGRTRERKLDIMRDSRIGTYGATVLMLSLALRATALATLADPSRVAAALIAAGVLGRAAMLLPLRLLPPARPDGLGASVAQGPIWASLLAGAFSIVMVFALLPAPKATIALAITMLAGWRLAAVARNHIGGTTGDVLGACEIATECLVLTLCAMPTG